MSDTPRVDAAIEAFHSTKGVAACDSLTARQLERELARAVEARWLAERESIARFKAIQRLERELAALAERLGESEGKRCVAERERDETRAALREAIEHALHPRFYGDSLYDFVARLRKAAGMGE